MKVTVNRTALVLVAGAAAAILGQSAYEGRAGDWRVCTDGQLRRVLDSDCNGGGVAGHGGGWRYFSRDSSVPAIGETVNGGSVVSSSSAGFSSAPSGGVSRGGFGGTGEGFSSGHGGEGGGHGGGGGE